MRKLFQKRRTQYTWLIGVDEVGKDKLTGPFAYGEDEQMEQSKYHDFSTNPTEIRLPTKKEAEAKRLLRPIRDREERRVETMMAAGEQE